jgi:hypothetical protein
MSHLQVTFTSEPDDSSSGGLGANLELFLKYFFHNLECSENIVTRRWQKPLLRVRSKGRMPALPQARDYLAE